MLETLPAALPPRLAVRSPVCHVMLKPAGMRIRRSFAAVIPGTAASSAMVSAAMAVGGLPVMKAWLAADDKVGPATAMVLSSNAVTPAPDRTRSSRLSAADVALKLAKLRSATVSWSPAAKLLVTSSTSVRPPSS